MAVYPPDRKLGLVAMRNTFVTHAFGKNYDAYGRTLGKNNCHVLTACVIAVDGTVFIYPE